MELCKRTFLYTKELHRLVDNHIIIKEIHKEEYAKCYTNLIEMVLFVLEMKMKTSVDLITDKLYRKLIRRPQINKVDFNDVIKKLMKDFDNPLLLKSHIYIWYLSLVSGGKILKKILPEEYSYLFDFEENTKEELKEYIDDIALFDYTEFIENVKMIYMLIKQHFDRAIETKKS